MSSEDHNVLVHAGLLALILGGWIWVAVKDGDETEISACMKGGGEWVANINQYFRTMECRHPSAKD